MSGRTDNSDTEATSITISDVSHMLQPTRTPEKALDASNFAAAADETTTRSCL